MTNLLILLLIYFVVGLLIEIEVYRQAIASETPVPWLAAALCGFFWGLLLVGWMLNKTLVRLNRHVKRWNNHVKRSNQY